VNWRHSPPRSTPQYFAFCSLSQEVFSLFLFRACVSHSPFHVPPWIRRLFAKPRRQLPPLSHKVFSMSGGSVVGMLGRSKHFLLAHLCFLLACLRSPSARILHRQRSCLAGPAAPQSTHYPFSSLPLRRSPWSLRIGLKGPNGSDRPGYRDPLDRAKLPMSRRDADYTQGFRTARIVVKARRRMG